MASEEEAVVSFTFLFGADFSCRWSGGANSHGTKMCAFNTACVVRNCHTDSLCLQSYGDEVQDLTTDRVRDTTKGLAVHA